MSIVMDSQDLRGYLCGLCMITVVRRVGAPPSAADVREILGEKLAEEIALFIAATAAFSDMDAVYFQEAVDDLITGDDAYLELEHLNMQFGLLSRHPLPVFPFLEKGRVRDAAVLRPLLDASRGLLHAAVRLRMQTLPATSAGAFWAAALRFLRCMSGDGPTAQAMALSTILDVASDVIFFSTGAPNRTEDPALARQILHVLDELAAVPAEMDALAGDARWTGT